MAGCSPRRRLLPEERRERGDGEAHLLCSPALLEGQGLQQLNKLVKRLGHDGRDCRGVDCISELNLMTMSDLINLYARGVTRTLLVTRLPVPKKQVGRRGQRPREGQRPHHVGAVPCR